MWTKWGGAISVGYTEVFAVKIKSLDKGKDFEFNGSYELFKEFDFSIIYQLFYVIAETLKLSGLYRITIGDDANSYDFFTYNYDGKKRRVDFAGNWE